MDGKLCGNVLVTGSEGVGISTLIGAVVGSDVRPRGDGLGSIKVYESTNVPFRAIDAGDVGGSQCGRRRAVGGLKRWARHSALVGKTDTDVNVIWFCVEGKSRKLVRQQIADLSRATSQWRHAPIIVVITKSYAETERDENVALVRRACWRRRRLRENVKAIIPVVASTYELSDTAFVPPAGIPELIEATNLAMPAGVQSASKEISAFSLKRRQAAARSIIAASAAAAVTVGTVPIPISDALLLTPIETAEINALASLYGIDQDSTSKKLFSTILEVGTVSTAAKAAISALKAVPGVNLAASALNGFIAGSIAVALGEACIRIFERIYLGEKSLDDTEWARTFVESRISKELIAKGTKAIGKASGIDTGKGQHKEIVRLLGEAFSSKEPVAEVEE